MVKPTSKCILAAIFLSILTFSSFITPSLSIILGDIEPISEINSKTTGNLFITPNDFTTTQGWTHSSTIGKSQLLRLDTHTIKGATIYPFETLCMPEPAVNDPETQAYTRLDSMDGRVWHTWENTDTATAWMLAYFHNPAGTRRYWEVKFSNYVKCWSNWNDPGHISATQFTSQPQWVGNTFTQAIATVPRDGRPHYPIIPIPCNTALFNPDNNLLGDYWAESLRVVLWRHQDILFDDTDWWWDYSAIDLIWVEFYATGTATSPIYKLGDTTHLYKSLHDITYSGVTNGGTINLYYKVLSPSGTWSADWISATSGTPISNVLASYIQIQFRLTSEATLKQQSPHITSLTINYGDPPISHEPHFGAITQTPLANNVNYESTIDVSCNIDSGNAILQAVILEYSTDSSFTSFKSIPTTDTLYPGVATYTVTIPATQTVGATVHYRIRATNAYSPMGGTLSLPQSYTIIDDINPVIIHDFSTNEVHLTPNEPWTFPDLPKTTTSVLVECTVTDKSQISVTLNVIFNGNKNGGVISSTVAYSMTNNPGTNQWSATIQIPIDPHPFNGEIDYTITATDIYNNLITTSTYTLERWYPYIVSIECIESNTLNGGLYQGELVTYSIKIKNTFTFDASFILECDSKLFYPIGGSMYSDYPVTLATQDETTHTTILVPAGKEYTFIYSFQLGWPGKNANSLEWQWYKGEPLLMQAYPSPAGVAPNWHNWYDWVKGPKESIEMKVYFTLKRLSDSTQYDYYESSVKEVQISSWKMSQLSESFDHLLAICELGILSAICFAAGTTPWTWWLYAGGIACDLGAVGEGVWMNLCISNAQDPPGDYTTIFSLSDVNLPSPPLIEDPNWAILNIYNEISIEIMKYEIVVYETINRWHSAYIAQEPIYQELQANALNTYTMELTQKLQDRKNLIFEISTNLEQNVPAEILNSNVWSQLSETQIQLQENETCYNIVLNKLKDKLIPWGISESQIQSFITSACEYVPENPDQKVIELFRPEGQLFKYPYTTAQETIASLEEQNNNILTNTNDPQNYYESSCITIEPIEIIIVPGETDSFTAQIGNPTANSIIFNIEVDKLNSPCIINPTTFQLTIPPFQISTVKIEIVVPRQSNIPPGSSFINIIATPSDDPSFSFMTSVPIEILPFHEETVSITPEDQTIFDNQIATYDITLHNLGNVIETYSIDVIDLTIGSSCLKVEGNLVMNNEITINPDEIKIITLEITPQSLGTEIFTISVNSIVSLPAMSATITINDDDTTPPQITISYIGSETDGDSGSWVVSAVDAESGVASIAVEIDGILEGTSTGNYQVPNNLGTRTISITAANTDLDRGATDQESATAQASVIIVDDDITPPEISNLEISVGVLEIGVSLVATDVSGIGIFEFLFNGESVTPVSQVKVDDTYSFVFINDGGMIFGTNNLLITVWDADTDRQDDSLSSTVSGSFELTVGGMINFIQGELADLRTEVDNRVLGFFSWIIIDRLDAADDFLTDALTIYIEGCTPLSIILDKLAKANVELSDLITVILDYIGFISEEDGDFISNCLHTIRDHITLTMGAMIGTEEALEVAAIETQIEQLADQIFNDYNLCTALSIDFKLWGASENLDLALFWLACESSETAKNHVILCENLLNAAKDKIIQLRDDGDISAEGAQSLIATIDGFITELIN